jgi:hypothetical protein
MRVDEEGLARLVRILEDEFSDFDAACELWAGALGVIGTVASTTVVEALQSALTTVSAALDEAGLDVDWSSEITDTRIRRRSEARSGSAADSFQRTLLRLVSSSRRE